MRGLEIIKIVLIIQNQAKGKYLVTFSNNKYEKSK